MDQLRAFFSSAGFLPHGYCILWRPDILALHVISDAVIATSYFSIPLAIAFFVRRRSDLLAEHRRVAMLFGLFILGCGMTHVMGVVVLWRPLYALDGVIKAATAAVSILTAIVLWPMLPRLLEIPSPRALAQANERLQREYIARLAALEELQAIRSSLEAEVDRRTREVQALARRFEIATEGSVVTLSEQDEALRYTWVHNPRPPLTRDLVGRSDEEGLAAASAAVLAPLKRKVLESGEAVRADVALAVGEEARHFDIRITPAAIDGRGNGLLVASIDITEQKRQQEHLQTIMRELSHRAKNLLSLVDGVARQTAKAEGLPDAFVRRFGARLAALGAAHDLLVGRDWEGVDLDELVRAQLAHVLPEAPVRITIVGPVVTLTPEAAQYLGLAVHELATNAAKHGVIARGEGALRIAWRARRLKRGLKVELGWTETGQALTSPQRSGFGRLLLEQLVPRALGGQSSLVFGESGLAWRIGFEF